MAIAERFLAERYNRPHHEIVDHRVYAICSDGDLMEGVSDEAASIAGHLGLGKLVYFYDDNHITIDGTTALSFTTEDKGKRFEALRLARAVGRRLRGPRRARAGDRARRRPRRTRPSLIIVRSHIAYGAPHAVDTAKSHGSPLGEDEVARGEGGARLGSRQALRRPGRGVRAHGRASERGIEARAGVAATASSAGRRRSRSSARTGTPTAPASRGRAGSRRCPSSRRARRSPRATPARR